MKRAVELACLFVVAALSVLAWRVGCGAWASEGGSSAPIEAERRSKEARPALLAAQAEPPPAETLAARESVPVAPTVVPASALQQPAVAPIVEADRTVWGRLVDAETRLALGDGFVRIESFFGATEEADVPVRADGSFELHVRSWEQSFASAAADGHARVVFALEQGHETPARALDVLLSRFASLEVVVLDPDGPVSDASVGLSTGAYRLLQEPHGSRDFIGRDPTWSATTDSSGSTTLAELPPRVPLELVVSAEGRSPRREAEPLVLEPGERRRMEVSVAVGETVLGRVLDGAGRAVADREIALIPDRRWELDVVHSFDTPAATTRTDDEGRFHFDDVPSGDWLVGPPMPSSREWGMDAPDVPIGLAQLVHVETSASPLEVLLRADRGEYLRGTVLESDGRPAANCSVFARGIELSYSLSSLTNDSGHFSLGPVFAGNYSVRAGVAFSRSDSVVVQAGGASIELKFLRGGAIRGRVVDSSGQMRASEYLITRPGDEQAWMWDSSDDGTLDCRMLLPGTYTINVRTSDGLCGRASGVVIRAGETTDGVEIVLRAGARLKLRYAGEERVTYTEIFFDGGLVWNEALERGPVRTAIVPAGEVEVRWGWGSFVQRCLLAPGEERELSWDGKP